MTTLKIEYYPLSSLRPWQKNARTHSKKQLRQIADSIKEFGFTNPILIDDDASILAGHGRVEAAKQIGISDVPCVLLSSMSKAQKRAYVIADNKLAENAGWDDELLAEELQGLLDDDLGFDVELTGFSIAEIDTLVEGLATEEDGDPDDDIVPHGEVASRCQAGDIWQLGAHRMICGDARDPQTITDLMAGEEARMVMCVVQARLNTVSLLLPLEKCPAISSRTSFKSLCRTWLIILLMAPSILSVWIGDI